MKRQRTDPLIAVLSIPSGLLLQSGLSKGEAGMKKILIVMLIGAMAGCAATPSDFSSHEQAMAAKISAYAAGADTPSHSVIGPVESNSCDSKTMARFSGSEDEAVELLKLEAVRMGGNMVVAYSCRTQGVDLVSNCWASKRCTGQAAKAQP